MDYTVTLTDTEQKAMEYCAADVDDWITNAATNRARIAIEDIIALNTAHCNANSIAIAVGVDAQVQQAFDLGVVQTAAARNAAQISPA
jgi:hypothetical protein|tara:strand:- start:296 stop:559 length:264 start_codon:yes stop_codon:yes gene_type:complete